MSAKKKTVLRSFRMTEELDKLIKNDAAEKKVTVNTLITMILTKYAEWDRYTDKFGFVTITRDGFKSFVESIDDEKLIKIGGDLGSRNPKEMTQFWFKKLNLATFLRYLSLYCGYGGIAQYELETDPGYTITLHHELGEKYSRFLVHFFDHAIRTITGTTPHLEMGKNSVVITFPSYSAPL